MSEDQSNVVLGFIILAVIMIANLFVASSNVDKAKCIALMYLSFLFGIFVTMFVKSFVA